MRYRFKAFALHISASAVILILILGALYFGWYRYPGWYLAEAAHIVILLVAVDIALGPTLTLIVAHPQKLRRVLARDIAIIVSVQLLALGYGVVTLWHGRPLYYTFSADRLELVQASDLKTAELDRARHEQPALAPHWYSLPRWIWAPLPQDPQEAAKIVQSTVMGEGDDVIQMPRYYKPWGQGLSELRKQLRAIDELRYFTRTEKQTLKERMQQLGLPADVRDTLILWGGSRRVVVVFDPDTLRIRAMLRSERSGCIRGCIATGARHAANHLDRKCPGSRPGY